MKRILLRGCLFGGSCVVALLLATFIRIHWPAPQRPTIAIPKDWARGSIGTGDCRTPDECMSKRGNKRASSEAFRRYSRENMTRAVTEMASDNMFFRLEAHTVSMPPHKDQITGWMFCEVPDMINVLVQDEHQRFLVLEQTKYAIDGPTLALIGGYVQAGESAEDGARREVLEELSMRCTTMQNLGSYRTDANRGFGTLHAFLGKSCAKGAGPGYDDSDLEQQTAVYKTREQLKDALLRNQFKEVKWTATVALALLHT